MKSNKTLPSNWVRAKLGQVILPRETCNPNKYWNSDTFGYIDIEAVDNSRQQMATPKVLATDKAPSRARVAVRHGDVLFSLVRPYLKNIAIVPANLDGQVASTAFCVLRPAIGMESRFLYYQVCQESFINSIPTYGNSPPAARDDEFLDILIPVAPTNEQHRIAEKIEELFSKLDAGSAALERVAANLKRYRSSVLKAAVEGRLTEQWRAENPPSEPASKPLERILAERRRKWEEDQLAKYAKKGKTPPKNWRNKYKEPTLPDTTDLPPLPEGWCYTSLPAIIPGDGESIKTGPFGSLLKKHEHTNSGIPVLGIENIEAMRFIKGNKIFITPEKAAQLVDYDALPGDILVSRSGTVGEVCVVPEGLGDLRISTNLMRVRLVRSSMLPEFFCILFNGSPFVLQQVSELCSGSTRDFLNKKMLETILLPLPPLQEQAVIIQEVEQHLSLIEKHDLIIERALQRSTLLRQAILKRAFEGRLVPQDPNDEPASVLLERIAAERKAASAGTKTNQAGRKTATRKCVHKSQKERTTDE